MAESMTNSDLGSKDLSLVPEINFGFVENFAKAKSKSHGDKELSKGYKYFCEKYITNVSGTTCSKVMTCTGGHHQFFLFSTLRATSFCFKLLFFTFDCRYLLQG